MVKENIKASSKSEVVGKGAVCLDFSEPMYPLYLSLWTALPNNSCITSIRVDYVRMSPEGYLAVRRRYEDEQLRDREAHQCVVDDLEKTLAKAKRHDAAVKANATRKARKSKK